MQNAAFKYWKPVLFLLLLAGAVMVRVHFAGFESADYSGSFSYWYDDLKEHGFRSFKVGFSSYPTAYLLLLYLATLLPLSKIVSIKLISVVFDFLIASVMYRLVKEKAQGIWTPFSASMVLLWAPTVVVNGALWGQCDSIYTFFLLASLLAWMRGRIRWSFVLFGVAVSFKLQAVFWMPLYLVFIMEKKARIYHLLWIPLVYAVSVLPAVISGESLKLVFGLYGWQMERFNSLSLYAPNIYQWLVLIDTHHLSIAFLGLLGMLLWGGGLVTSILLIHRSRPRLDREDVVRIAMLFSLLSPFLLPRMHERYFFSADVLSILYAFYFPRRWFVPLLVIGSSFLSYLPFLFGETPVGMPVLALTMGCALLTVAVEVVASLGSSRSTGDMGKTDVS